MEEEDETYRAFAPYSNHYGTKHDYGSFFRTLSRPRVDHASLGDLVFFLTDADYTFMNVKSPPDSFSSNEQDSGDMPIIRLFGVTKDQHSVLALLKNFNPYFYIEMPPNLNEEHLDDLKTLFDKHLSEQSQFKRSKKYVLDIQKVKLTSLMLFDEKGEKDFLKITVSIPRMVANLRSFIESGIYLKVYEHNQEKRIPLVRQTYEANLPYILRFLLDSGVVSGAWLKIPSGKYKLTVNRMMNGNKDREDSYGWERCSTCSIEVVAEYYSVISLPLEGEYEAIAPLRIVSFDIECIKLQGLGFPNPNNDPVIQISSVIYTQGKDINETKNFVFTLKECDQLANATVLSFETEEQMLLAWSDFMVQVDPDFLTGYNIILFDMPYMITRSTVLGIDRFKKLTRIRSISSNFRDAIVSNNMMGTYENKEINIEGRILFDVYDLIRREYKLKSYTLNYVSFEFLNQQKEDVHYSTISKLQQGSRSDRRRIASYCLKDAILPLLLIHKLLLMFNYIEMARVTNTPIKFLITRGQQIRVTMQIYRQCKKMKYVIPVINSSGRNSSNENSYEGATVLDPQKGYHKKAIAVLDFQSLYPSIMIAYNLCYSTLLPHTNINKYSDEDVTKVPGYNDLCFVKATRRKGVLPLIVENLIEARKNAKKLMASTDDPVLKKVYDGRQKALKVTTNSVYGYTGAASGGFLPCVDVATAVTSFGRNIILNTKMLIEEEFTLKNGYKHDAKVVYGDTDSVMINFGTDEVQEAIELGHEAANKVTEKSIRPITLLFEKVYKPMLLLNKKRYAGLFYNNSESYEKIDCKGIETVRRDFCMLVQQMMERVLYLLLVESDVKGAIDFVKKKVSELLRNEIDISLLVITKSLGKVDYEQRLPHVELAKKLRKRDPGNAPGVGDRISYIIVKGTKGEPQYDRAEEPLYVTENNLPIDTNHYLESIKTTLKRIFDVVIDNSQSLFSGEHTRVITISSSTEGLMNKFLKKVNRCLSCNIIIKNSSFCDNCNQAKKQQVLLDKLKLCRVKEDVYFKLWTHCQRCQGNLHNAVMCDNRDCPIFYKRVKTAKDLSQLESTLNGLRIEYED